MDRKTKIICTIGPASESRPQLTVVYSYIQRDAVNQQNEEQ